MFPEMTRRLAAEAVNRREIQCDLLSVGMK